MDFNKLYKDFESYIETINDIDLLNKFVLTIVTFSGDVINCCTHRLKEIY